MPPIGIVLSIEEVLERGGSSSSWGRPRGDRI